MGGLIRLAIIAAIVWFVYQKIQKWLAAQSQQPSQQSSQPQHNNTMPPPSQERPQLMQPCAQCKVLIPEGESTQSRGKFFCCEAHRDAFFRG